MLIVIQNGQFESTEFDSLSDSLPRLDKKGIAILLKILDTPREGTRI